jgi:hypothetical protein
MTHTPVTAPTQFVERTESASLTVACTDRFATGAPNQGTDQPAPKRQFRRNDMSDTIVTGTSRLQTQSLGPSQVGYL